MPSVKQPLPFTPYWQTTDEATVRLYQGHVIHALRWMPGKSVQEVVTSPPYWGLRDYGTGTWTGGDPGCDHKGPSLVSTSGTSMLGSHDGRGGNKRPNATSPWLGGICGKCGATRTDHQLGSEASPDCLGWARGENCAEKDWATGCHVCRMVLVFREVRRVLRDDGTLWLNYGDSYVAQASGSRENAIPTNVKQRGLKDGFRNSLRYDGNFKGIKIQGLKNGNLCGVPWRVALALQADGWVLRQDVIWNKPAPMPESVVNRCTKAHEYVFLLTKGSKYFYDAEAVKEIGEGYGRSEGKAGFRCERYTNNNAFNNSAEKGKSTRTHSHEGGRNKRSVWSVDDERALLDWLAANDPGLLEKYLAESGYKSDVWRVASAGYPGAHYATFPPKLITPCILAGTSEYGCCGECGAPWKRVTEETKLRRERPNEYVKRTGEEGTGNSCANTVAGVETKTVGWEPTCTCNGEFVKRKVRVEKSGNRYTGGDRNEEGDCGASPRSQGETETTLTEYIPSIPLEDHPVIPCTVLDPFIGSGTTAIVALDHGRHCVGIDLSKQYLDENAIPRIRAWFNARPDLRSLIGTLTRPAPKQGKSVVRNGVGG